MKNLRHFCTARREIQIEKDYSVWIYILSQKLKNHMNESMHALGITGIQSRILHYIFVKRADGPVFQRDVESAFGFSRSTATEILKLMERDGLLLRENMKSDGRLKNLIPTQKAAHLDEQIIEYLHKKEKQLIDGLSEKQLSLFLQTVVQMCENLDK